MGLFKNKKGKIIGKKLKKIDSNLMDKKEFQIQIIGVGGAGGNIVNYICKKTSFPDFVRVLVTNTDYSALHGLNNIDNANKWVLAKDILKGDGAGGDPKVGFNAAVADKEKIISMLDGTDLLFVVSGFGKGTGTGATSVIGKIAKDLGITTIGVFNIPSYFVEGEKVYNNAIQGLANSAENFDSYIAVSNDKIIKNSQKNTSISDAFEKANAYISTIINEIIDLIITKHEINVDFADIKSFFKDKKAFLYSEINIVDFSENIIKDTIKTEIENGIAEINIYKTDRALIRFDLNKKVPSEVLATTREALKNIFKNSDVDITSAVNYSENVEGAQIKIITLGEMNADLLEKMREKKVKLNTIDFEKNVNNSKTAKIALNEWYEQNQK